MAVKRNPILKAKELASRLNGSTMPLIGAGVSWSPPVDERDKAKRLLVFLEDRRVLYQPYEIEIGQYVIRSIIEIRQRLVSDLEEIDSSSELAKSLKSMLAACRSLLDKTQHPSMQSYRMEGDFMLCLGELRALFGIQIARIAYGYDLDIEGELISILPPPEQE